MGKRIFILLIVLMSVSLVGIILIQSFFIFKNYEENDKQFSINVNYVLEETASIVERNEFRKYVRKFRDLIADESKVDTLSIQNLIIIDQNPEKYGYDIDLKDIAEFENKIIERCKSDKPELIESIQSSGKLEEATEKSLIDVITNLKKNFKS